MRGRDLSVAFRCALGGLWLAFRTQRNMRIQVGIGLGVVAVGLWLRLTPDRWALLAVVSGLVLVSEMINTAVEWTVDLVCPDYHPLAKTVKDVMAGAVFLSAIVAVVVGLLILGPPLWGRLMHRSVGQ